MYRTHGSISLRDFTVDDIDRKITWINDPDNNKYLHYDIPLEYPKTLAWFRNKDDNTRIDCVIEYDNIPVGVIGLLGIDDKNKKAEYYITIGDKQYKHKGIATKASLLILEYAFEALELNKVYLNVDADNEIACRLYERVGFACEGYFREDLLRREHLIDRKRYAFLREFWDSKWRDNES